MNTETRAAMQAALAYVRWQAFGECRTADWDGAPPTAAEIDTLLVAALAQPEQAEPVAWFRRDQLQHIGGGGLVSAYPNTDNRTDLVPLYATPQQSEPDTELQLAANLLQEYGLQALDIVEAFKKRTEQDYMLRPGDKIPESMWRKGEFTDDAYSEKCEGLDGSDQSLPERCNSQADKLDQLAEQFKQIRWGGHRLRIVDLTGHLRIYAHQIKAKLEESK